MYVKYIIIFLLFVNSHNFKDAELASLTNNPDAFKLYDVAVKYAFYCAKAIILRLPIILIYRLAVNNDWLLEEGWGLYLVNHLAVSAFRRLKTFQQGCHFVRCGVEGLGSELQRRGIARHSQWGAKGIV